jgi:two-component system CheB/CheR fusion protein
MLDKPAHGGLVPRPRRCLLEGGEVGEPIGILSAEVPELPKLAAQVMRRRKGIEKEIVQADDHHYSLRLRPYVTSNGEVEGAVIFLVNIDQIKAAEQERQELSETLATLFESAPDAVMTVNAAGRIEWVNGQAEKCSATTVATSGCRLQS